MDKWDRQMHKTAYEFVAWYFYASTKTPTQIDRIMRTHSMDSLLTTAYVTRGAWIHNAKGWD